jgi:hypothetical protein
MAVTNGLAKLAMLAAATVGTVWAASEAPGICPAQKRSLAALHAICPLAVFERSTENPPWTHEPFCVESDNKWNDHFCVYTNADFRFGRGISIITDGEGAEKIAWESAVGVKELQVPSPSAKEAPYMAREQPGRGVGLFVNDGVTIKAGRTILVDYPLVVVNREAMGWVKPDDFEELQWLAVLQLSNYSQRRIRNLARSRGSSMDEISDIMKTNSIGQSFGEARHLSIFPDVAVSRVLRWTHAQANAREADKPRLPPKVRAPAGLGAPNSDHANSSFYRFNESTMALEVFALRDLEGGEEITFAYLDDTLNAKREKRIEHLKENWNFECKCSLCAGTEDEIALSDDRRNLMESAKERLRHSANRPKYLYRAATQLVQLYEDEGLIAPRARANEIAAYAAAMIGDENEARKFANAAKRYWRIMAGKDSGEVQRMDELRRDPTSHPSWKAELKVGEGPEGAQPKEVPEDAGARKGEN